MNAAHLHLAITHLPVVGTIGGVWLLLVALWQSSPELRRASLWAFVLSGLAALPSYLSGRPASLILARLTPGMSMDPGDQHAEVAILALTGALVLAAVALLGLLFYRRGKTSPRWFTVLVLLLALVTVSTLGWTVTLGARIRHPEIQSAP